MKFLIILHFDVFVTYSLESFVYHRCDVLRVNAILDILLRLENPLQFLNLRINQQFGDFDAVGLGRGGGFSPTQLLPVVEGLCGGCLRPRRRSRSHKLKIHFVLLMAVNRLHNKCISVKFRLFSQL